MEKCKLTEQNRIARLNFAEAHKDFVLEYWNNVVFLDEKTFSTAEDGRRHVWRPLNKATEPKYVVQLKRSGRLTLGYWGYISVAKAGDLIEVGPRMHALRYVDLSENYLKPGVRAVMPEEDFPIIKIVQDNSGVHRAALVQR